MNRSIHERMVVRPFQYLSRRRRGGLSSSSSSSSPYICCQRFMSMSMISNPPHRSRSITQQAMIATTAIDIPSTLMPWGVTYHKHPQQRSHYHQLQLQRHYHQTTLVSLSSMVSPKTTTTTTMSNHDENDNVELPSNVTFDFKSSFSPTNRGKKKQPQQKQKSSTTVVDSNDDNNDDNLDDEVQDDFEEDDDDDDLDLDLLSNTNLREVIPLPDRLKQNVYHGPDGTISGSIWLNESVFGVDPIRIDLIKQSVDYIRAKIRGQRKAKTKTISEKSGSGRKVRQQKGTGRARAGHSRPAHWRGGAKAHGPKNTVDYGNIKMNAKQKRIAIRSVLSQKCLEGNLIVVDHLQLPTHKTRDWSNLLEQSFGIGGKRGGSSTALIVDHYYEPDNDDGNTPTNSSSSQQPYHASYHGVPINLWVASSNIQKIKVTNQRFANVYDILKREKLIVTLSALEQMETKWKDV